MGNGFRTQYQKVAMRFLPVILEYLRAKKAGQPFDLGPAEEGFTVLPVLVVGSRESYETAGRYLPFISQRSSEQPKLADPTLGPALFVIAYTPDQKGRRINGSLSEALGCDYDELVRETVRLGAYQREYRKGEWTTLVFGAKDAAGLDGLLRGFMFEEYIVRPL